MMQHAPDIMAKVFTFLFLPLAYAFFQIGRMLDKWIFLEETPWTAAILMQGALFALLVILQISQIKKNKAIKEHYQKKNDKKG